MRHSTKKIVIFIVTFMSVLGILINTVYASNEQNLANISINCPEKVDPSDEFDILINVKGTRRRNNGNASKIRHRF